MKTFTVEVVSTVDITLDETKFTPEFFEEFNGSITDWCDDLEEHAKHLAWVHATGVEDLAYVRSAPFVEGYGPVDEMGIQAVTRDTEMDVVEVSP